MAHKAYKNDNPDVKLSKTLSWILRHGATKLGLSLDSEGFIPVKTLLARPELRGSTLQDIERIVTTNAKQRFCIKTEPSTSELLIRANQGHSLNIENLELEEITNSATVPVVIHGTFRKNLASIRTNGLSKMNRQHIHFAPGLPNESGVISGMRKSCDVFIFVNLELALLEGLKFYKSANNVILSPGNEHGFLLPKYFLKIEEK